MALNKQNLQYLEAQQQRNQGQLRQQLSSMSQANRISQKQLRQAQMRTILSDRERDGSNSRNGTYQLGNPDTLKPTNDYSNTMDQTVRTHQQLMDTAGTRKSRQLMVNFNSSPGPQRDQHQLSRHGSQTRPVAEYEKGYYQQEDDGSAAYQTNNDNEPTQQSTQKQRRQQNAPLYKENFITISLPLVSKTTNSGIPSLPEVEFIMTPTSVDQIYEVILKSQPATQQDAARMKENFEDYSNMLQHVSQALWMLHKLFIQSELSFKQVSLSNHTQFLSRMNYLIQNNLKEWPEVTLNALRVTLAFLQKVDQAGMQIPITEIKNTNLLEQSMKLCLCQERPLFSPETVHLSLKVLIQISYSYPREISLELIKRVIALCQYQNDFGCQDNAIKLLCNLFTDEQQCAQVLKNDGIFAVYQCLLSDSKQALKFGLGALLNLTLLSENRLNSQELILTTGGLSHLMAALQKSFGQQDIQSSMFGLRALTNLSNFQKPVVKMVVAELGYMEIIIQLIKQMFQTLLMNSHKAHSKNQEQAKKQVQDNEHLKGAVSAGMQALHVLTEGVNGNKILLVEKTSFLQLANRLVQLSTEKPSALSIDTLLSLFGLLSSFSLIAVQFSKKFTTWEGGELAFNILKLLEHTDSDAVLRAGLKIFINMQESSLLLSSELHERINQLNEAQSKNSDQWSTETMQSFQRIFFLIQNTPLTKKMLTPDGQLADEEMDKVQTIRKATRNCFAILKEKTEPIHMIHDKPTSVPKISGREIAILKNSTIQEKEFDNSDQINNDYQNEQALFLKKREARMKEVREIQMAMARKQQKPPRANEQHHGQASPFRLTRNSGREFDNQTDFSRMETQSLIEHGHRAMSTISGHNLGSSNQSVAAMGSHRATMKKGHQLQLGMAALETSQRSKSLLRQGEKGISRMAKFNDHVERFNQLEPLISGQMQSERKESQALGDSTRFVQPNAMSQYTMATLPQPEHNGSMERQPYQKPELQSKLNTIQGRPTSSILKQHAYGSNGRDNSPDDGSVYKPMGGPLSVHSFREGSQIASPGHAARAPNQLGPYVSNLAATASSNEFERTESRGSLPGVQSLHFGQKKTTSSFVTRPGSRETIRSQSESQPVITEEFKQPNFQDYYGAEAQQNLPKNFKPVNPFPSTESPRGPQPRIPDQQLEKSPNRASSNPPVMIDQRHYQGLGTVPEEAELYGMTSPADGAGIPRPQSFGNTSQFQQNPTAPRQQPPQQIQGARPPPRDLDEMVKQNQQFVIEKMNRGKASSPPREVALPQMPVIDKNKYSGQEKVIVQKYLDANLLDKDSFEAKNARFYMGIGMPEARSMQKRTNCSTFRDQMEWYRNRLKTVGEEGAQNEVQKAICSSQYTAKVIALYLLAADALGNPIS